jgi:hypothetical protein
MMIMYALLFLSILLESTITTLPFSLSLLLILMVVKRNETPLIAAVITGLSIDIMTMRVIGVTGLFALLFLFLIVLYDRKFEIATFPFVTGASFMGSIVYLFIFQVPQAFIQAVTVAGITGILFMFFKRQRIHPSFTKKI